MPSPSELTEAKREVLRLLRAIDPFPARKDTRKQVRQPGQTTPYYQFALGRVVKLDTGITHSRFNARFPELHRACRRLMHTRDPLFRYDAIQINKNQQCAPHKDTNNHGPSYIIGLGDYTGGELVINKMRKVSIRNKFVMFDGTELHETTPFKGERYSLVFFRIKDSHKRRGRKASPTRRKSTTKRRKSRKS